MKPLRILSALLAVSLFLPLFACGSESAQAETTAVSIDLSAYDFSLSGRDTDDSYDPDCEIRFTDSGAEIVGSGAQAEGGIATITEAGCYLVSGECDTGRLIVRAAKTDKVQIVLNGLTLSSQDGCALLIEQADKVFLTLAEGTANALSDAAAYEMSVGETSVDAAVFSKDDLTINGGGELRISGNFKHGIVSKDDFTMTNGLVTIESVGCGIEGKDGVKLAGGTLSIVSGGDGIQSDNAEEAGRGYVYIEGADLTIVSETDCVQAETLLYVASGKLNLTSGGGAAVSSRGTGFASRGGWGDWGESAATEDTKSAKGLKCAGNILIEGGEIDIDSSDDSVHSNDTLLFSGGTLTAASGDDGAHADSALCVSGGEIRILRSYEGLESGAITISGGNISVTADDDGLNAAGGSDSSALGGRMGQNPFAADSAKTIAITGGYTVIDASGDGVDSNGSISVSGGVTLVSGPTNSGNGAIDTGTEAVISGGVFIACGASGMAESFSSSSTQGSLSVNLSGMEAGAPIALCDENGTVLCSFTPAKTYQNVVISAPGLTVGNTYTLRTGKVSGADKNGYAENAAISEDTLLETVEMTSIAYGASGFSMGGGFGGGFGGGMGGKGGGFGGFSGSKGSRGERPSSDTGTYGGEIPQMPDGMTPPDGEVPQMPDGMTPPDGTVPGASGSSGEQAAGEEGSQT